MPWEDTKSFLRKKGEAIFTRIGVLSLLFVMLFMCILTSIAISSSITCNDCEVAIDQSDCTKCDINAECILFSRATKYTCQCKIGWAGNGERCGLDTDGDSWPDEKLNCTDAHCARDNCPRVPNSGQEDEDQNGIGDVCDSSYSRLRSERSLDYDGDGFLNREDNCPDAVNPDQKDSDGDGVGDACDNCPNILNADQADLDMDMVGDVCDTDEDRDSDGVQDSLDNCPDLANSDQLDTDGDGQGDACDSDKDGDGILNEQDLCPLNHNYNSGRNCGGDFDGDGVPDLYDVCPDNRMISKTDFRRFKTVALDPSGTQQEDPNWIISDSGAQIEQTVNSDPGLAVGVETFEDVDFIGTFFVNDNADDDYVGFVFSYQDNKNFYVVAWKKAYQRYFSTYPPPPLADAGIQLKVVHSSTGPGIELRDALWSRDSTSDQATILWKDTKQTPWISGVAYRWSLIHRPSIGLIKFKLFQGETLIANSGNITDHSLKGGKLGVYCFSQEAITWSNLIYRCNRAVP